MTAGVLAEKYGFGHLELKVCKSNAGFYLGTWGEGGEDFGPISRESTAYWATEQEAYDALLLGHWIQRKQS